MRRLVKRQLKDIDGMAEEADWKDLNGGVLAAV